MVFFTYLLIAEIILVYWFKSYFFIRQFPPSSLYLHFYKFMETWVFYETSLLLFNYDVIYWISEWVSSLGIIVMVVFSFLCDDIYAYLLMFVESR